MNQLRLLFTFVAALIVALGASFFVYQKLTTTSTAGASTRTVVVAARDLSIGVPLTAPDLKSVRWAGDQEPPGAVTSVEEVVGRPLIYPVFAGEPLLTSKLAAEGSGAGLGAVITEGMRAVSIRVDEVVAVAGFVVAGSRVDVLLTGLPTKSGSGDTVTQTILEDVQVLAAGQKIQPDAEGKPQRVNVVTLLCAPEDAARVVLAGTEGRIQLVLRNPTDKPAEGEQRVSYMVKRTELYANGAAAPQPAPRTVYRPAPAPEPLVIPEPEPTSAPVMMIRGSKVSEIDVPLD